MKKRAIIIDPNFIQRNQLSSKRMNSFREWLEEINFETFTIAKANVKEGNEYKNDIIFIADPIQKFYLIINKIEYTPLKRILHIIFNVVNSILLIPDSNYFWYKKVLQNDDVDKILRASDIVISSNPPESSHSLNYYLSKKYKSISIIDIRDGWNDESLNFYRKFLPFRSNYEKQIEKKIYNNAKIIFTNSNGWEKLITNRISNLKNKFITLPNKLDEELLGYTSEKKESDKKIIISYAGKFTGSSFRRRPKLIFEPFTFFNNKTTIDIKLWGDFRKKDLKEISHYKKKLSPKNISISVNGFVDKSTLYKSYNDTDGFLLLSNSMAAIPSKVYEYIYVSKPILAFVLKESSVHKFLIGIPKVVFYFLDSENSEDKIFNDYFELCSKNLPGIDYPDNLTEIKLKEKFQSNIHNILTTNNA